MSFDSGQYCRTAGAEPAADDECALDLGKVRDPCQVVLGQPSQLGPLEAKSPSPSSSGGRIGRIRAPVLISGGSPREHYFSYRPFTFELVLLGNRSAGWLGVNWNIAGIEQQYCVEPPRSTERWDLCRTRPFGNLVRMLDVPGPARSELQ